MKAKCWLENQYSPGIKQKVIGLVNKIESETDEKLEEELVIEGFANLKKIEIAGGRNFSNNEQHTIKFVKLTNLPSLTYVNLNRCQITNIDVSKCLNIKEFNVGNNLLTSLDFLNNLSSEELTILSIHSNNFSKQDLSAFSKLVNLQELYIDNCDINNFFNNIFNCFYGSLKPLEKLKKLKYLSIGNTDIDSKLEHLPVCFKKIGCGDFFNWLIIKGFISADKCDEYLSKIDSSERPGKGFLKIYEKLIKSSYDFIKMDKKCEFLTQQQNDMIINKLTETTELDKDKLPMPISLHMDGKGFYRIDLLQK